MGRARIAAEKRAEERAAAAALAAKVVLVQTRISGDVHQRLALNAAGTTVARYVAGLIRVDAFPEQSDRVSFALTPEDLQKAARFASFRDKTVHGWAKSVVVDALSDAKLVSAWALPLGTTSSRRGLTAVNSTADYKLRWLRDISIDERVFELLKADGLPHLAHALAGDLVFVEGRPLAVAGSRRVFRHETMAINDRVEITLAPI